MNDFTMTIAGSAVPTEKSFGVINPATGEVFAEAPACSREQLDAAFDAASKAQRDWASDEGARRTALLAISEVLMASGEILNPILTSEQGKPLGEAAIETFGAAIWCQYYAALETPSQIIQDDEDFGEEESLLFRGESRQGTHHKNYIKKYTPEQVVKLDKALMKARKVLFGVG